MPDHFVLPSKFRTEYKIKGEFICWHIVDYATWNREQVKELNEEQMAFSPWGTWNDALLVERISEGWSLSNWR